AITSTRGKRSRTIAGLPSDEPLSTTTVSSSISPAVSATDARHSASSSRVFQFAMITATVATGCVHSANRAVKSTASAEGAGARDLHTKSPLTEALIGVAVGIGIGIRGRD